MPKEGGRIKGLQIYCLHRDLPPLHTKSFPASLTEQEQSPSTAACRFSWFKWSGLTADQ